MSGSGPLGAIPPTDHEEVKGPRAGLRVTGAREKWASGMRMQPPGAVFACGQWLVPLPPRLPILLSRLSSPCCAVWSSFLVLRRSQLVSPPAGTRVQPPGTRRARSPHQDAQGGVA